MFGLAMATPADAAARSKVLFWDTTVLSAEGLTNGAKLNVNRPKKLAACGGGRVRQSDSDGAAGLSVPLPVQCRLPNESPASLLGQIRGWAHMDEGQTWV